MIPGIILVLSLLASTMQAQVAWPNACSQSVCPRIPGAVQGTFPPESVSFSLTFMYAIYMSNVSMATYLNNTCQTASVIELATNDTVSTILQTLTTYNYTANTTSTTSSSYHVYANDPSDWITLNPDGTEQAGNFSRIVLLNDAYWAAYSCITVSSNCYQFWAVGGPSPFIPVGAPWIPQLQQLGLSTNSNNMYNYCPTCYL